MKRITILVCVLALAGCGPTGGGDDDDAAASGCNGEQDIGEFSVDDAYDADGDGFFDPDDPGCAATYDADELDCDDEDALVNPDAEEVQCNETHDDCDASTEDAVDNDADTYTECDGDCDDSSQLIHPGADDEPCNGIDEDCNGDDGEPCDVEYSGTWQLTSDVVYSCDAATIDFDGLLINQEGTGIVVSVQGDGPDNLQGDFTSDTQFTAEQVVGAGSGCSQNYSMLGTFTSADVLAGSLTVNFAGADCSAKGCASGNHPFEATRE